MKPKPNEHKPMELCRSVNTAYKAWLNRRGFIDTNSWNNAKDNANKILRKNPEYLADLAYEKTRLKTWRNI